MVMKAPPRKAKPKAKRESAKSAPKAGATGKPASQLIDQRIRALGRLLGWKRDLGKRLDRLIVRNVPNVRKAVKWNSPFYGIERQGWFLSFHVFTRYVKVIFFRGTSLRPAPRGGTGKEARWIDVHEDDLDEAQMTKWVKQAAALPGFLGPRA